MDEALAILARHGISAILGTPTAAMPAWAAHCYPEVMAMGKNGQRIVWGVRKNNCFSSPVYRRLSRGITRAMAEHFAKTPNVIGWQTDNEFGEPVCYCDSCRAAFQNWLMEKYGSLEALNQAWGTHFWGQAYQDWAEIQFPTEEASHNPSLLLDHKRFNSWLNVRFQAEQIEIIRETCPEHFVTHNLMGLYPNLNYYDLAKDLDFVSWDNYPIWGRPTVPIYASAAADVMRGLKRQNFWIMETTAGPGGWGVMGRNPQPGEIRKVALQQVAHGCDGLVWFRWRTCTAGREQYWHGLLGHDGKALRRYQEAAETAADMRRLEPETNGTTVKAEVAMIYDYESNWAFMIQPAYSPVQKTYSDGWWGQNYTDAIRRYYEALFRAGVNVDMIPPTADFRQYKAVFAPHLHLLPDTVANQLRAYVQQGGVLLTDCRSAVKNETNLAHDRTLPGLLSDPLGIQIEEYEALVPGLEYAMEGQSALAGQYTAHSFADWVTAQNAESLVDYQPWHMQPFAAATRNRYGTGWGYYVGTLVKEESFYDGVIADVLEKAGVQRMANLPAGVEGSIREGEGRKLLFLINHTEEEQAVSVPAGLPELLSGKMTEDRLTLPRFGIAVVKLA
jgi:beta-galactosidase